MDIIKRKGCMYVDMFSHPQRPKQRRLMKLHSTAQIISLLPLVTPLHFSFPTRFHHNSLLPTRHSSSSPSPTPYTTSCSPAVGTTSQPTRQSAAMATKVQNPMVRVAGQGEAKGFVDEMRCVAMKLHTKDQAREGGRDADPQPFGKWEMTVEGYLKFLVDSKVVFDTLEGIVLKASHPSYVEFQNTGLERAEQLAMDLDWFRKQGHAIPEPSTSGLSYAQYLEDLSERNPQGFICHFYNVYFAHTAGGRMIGKKVAEKILDRKVLEFYIWEGDLSKLMQKVKDKLNTVTKNWSREEKDDCLHETEISFQYSGEILRLIRSC